jgi:hypothetical protein
MIRKFAIISTIFILSNCSNISPNKYQVKATKEKVECYENLINLILLDELLEKKILEIRKTKKRGKSDPVFVNQQFRLIELAEFEKLLPKNSNCLQRLKQDKDLKGIRFINKDSIIIEVNSFERRTLSERYTNGTIETHRIYISKRKIKNRTYKFKSERTKFIVDLNNDWTYEITHRAKLY